MITITSKTISDDQNYVLISLSDGTEIAVDVSWSTKYVQEPYVEQDGDGNDITLYRDTAKSLLEYELEQCVVLAQARADATSASLAAAQSIIAS